MTLDVSTTRLMGVLNVTPDSFSDGGRHGNLSGAVEWARSMASEGADLIDVGGESTRPGAEPVSLDEELRRTIPVVAAVAAEGLLVSIDTTKPEVAQAALEAGAVVVNDVTGLGDPNMVDVVRNAGCGVVIMHMQGTPRTMQEAPSYTDVIADVLSYLLARRSLAVEAGVNPDAVCLDPGIGFGKTIDHNLAILRRLDRFVAAGSPVMVGASRKSFLGHLSGEPDPERRDDATAATTAVAVMAGVAMVRVHNVAASAVAARVVQAIVAGRAS